MTDEKNNPKDEATVYFDGDCPMCRLFTAQVEPIKENGSTNFTDLRKGELPEGVDQESAERYIHVEDTDGKILRGAPAVLRILERKSKLLPLVKLGRLPLFSTLANLIYAFVAANRFFLFGPYAKIYWTKNAIAIGFLIPLIITRKLWFGAASRFYALTPIHPSLPLIDYPIDRIVFSLMVLLLLLITFMPNPRRWIIAFLAIAIPYSFWDQSRWMPYNYQFVVMLLPLAFFNWRPEPDQQKALKKWLSICATLSIVVISIWMWSGIHKISMRYFAVGYPWLISPFTEGFSEHMLSLVHATAFFSTPTETGGALMLLFRKTRNLGVLVITAMHMFILLTFGPLGHSFNHSVWSWNVAMLAFVWLFFWNNRTLSFRDILFGNGFLHKLIALFFLVLPVLNYFGHYDDFFSHKLYSWTTKEAEIEVHSSEVIEELPEEMSQWIHDSDGRQFVHVLKWSYSLFESPPYHAYRVFHAVFQKTCDTVELKQDLELVIFETPHWITARSEQVRYRCGTSAPILIE